MIDVTEIGGIKITKEGEEFLKIFEVFTRITQALRPKDSTEKDDETRLEAKYRFLEASNPDNKTVVIFRIWESLILKMKRKNPDASDDDIFSWFRLLLSGDWTIADLKKGIAKSTIYPDIDWDIENMRPMK